MRLPRTIGLFLICTFGLTVAACGKTGTPNATGDGSPVPAFTVSNGVALSGSPTFDRIKKRGHVVIGVKDDQPGLGLRNPTTGEYTGFDIEIANLVAAKLGYGTDKITYDVVDSANREQAIVNGDIDLYVGTYVITAARKQQVSFAGPYFRAGQSLLVRNNEQDITGPTTLQGKKVCSVTGSTNIQLVERKHLTAPGNVVQFQNYSQCVDKLVSGGVDVVTGDNAILEGYVAQTPDQLKLAGQPFSDEPYGVGLAKNDSVLRNKIDDILQQAIDDGTWSRLYAATLGKSGVRPIKPTIERY